MIEPDLLHGDNLIGLFVPCLVDHTVGALSNFIYSLIFVVLVTVTMLLKAVHLLCLFNVNNNLLLISLFCVL